jgi:DNA-binding NarL/FixJ family response regulator
MQQDIKILIADDHKLFLEGIKTIINSIPELRVVADASNGEEVLVKLKSYYVDVVLLDIQMPKLNGIQTTQIISEKYPAVKLIALSMHMEKAFIEKMYNSGASGYILKSSHPEELIKSIFAVYKGEKYYSGEVIPHLLQDQQKDNFKSNIVPELTKRETEILTLIAREYNNSKIAAELFLSIQTVNTHRKNLLRKLDVNNTAGLVKYAITNNLI